ncbi:MAG: MFS transporter [Spirochaetales bacterium]|nr:MFS transporter [Spirochaetales bacterium]MBP7263240.1 MFS transporter [Spirochaetia bacterium]
MSDFPKTGSKAAARGQAASTSRLPLGVKLGFGVADLGGNLFFTAMGFWTLFFLTDVVGIAAAAAGAIYWAGKLWDAVTDPLTGFISDRTRTRWGRRRPFMLFGAVPQLLAMWLFFTKPPVSSPWLVALWSGLALCLLNTAFTIVNIPYGALTPDLTPDYHERTSLNGYRFSFAILGTMLGAVAVQPLVGLFPSQAQGFSAVGLIFGVVMAVTALITVFTVKEGDHSSTPVPKEGFFETFMVVFKNKPFVVLIATYGLNLVGIAFVETILVYYFKWLYRDEGATSIAMLVLLVVAMLAIPVSVLVSKRIGKKRTYQINFAILAVTCLVIFFLGHRLGMTFFYAMMAFAGIGLGFGYALPFAMVPDTVEYDAVTTGKRKEGAFYGMWTFIAKVGTATAVVLTGLLLQWAGYSADLAAQSGATLSMIRWLIGPIPAVVFIAAILLVERYTLDEKTYRALMDTEARQEAEGR